MKTIWLLAGGNGSGKTTFYYNYLNHLGLPFINADEIKKAKRLTDEEAQQDAHQMYADSLKKGFSFCYETVFSHPSKLQFIRDAQKVGYQVNLIYIHLEDPQLNVARIHTRVQNGGHDVPEEKVKERIKKLIENVKEAILIADNTQIYNNTGEKHELEATLIKGVVTQKNSSKSWLVDFLKLAKEK